MVILRLSSVVVVLVAGSTLFTLAGGLPAPLGDAGTGTDAGGSRESAMALAYGAYDGNLTVQDADWYVFPGGARPACVDIAAVASNSMSFGVAVGDSSVSGLADAGVLDVTVASVGPVSFGALPDEDVWAFTSVGPYSFALARSAASVMGDRKHHDAPSSPALAAPVPGDCFGATFKHDGSDVDVWTFDAAALDLVTFSLAVGPQATGILEILGPDGNVVAGPISGDAVDRFLVTTPGTYAVRATSVSSWDSADYVVALTVGPDPSGCRPYCHALG